MSNSFISTCGILYLIFLMGVQGNGVEPCGSQNSDSCQTVSGEDVSGLLQNKLKVLEVEEGEHGQEVTDEDKVGELVEQESDEEADQDAVQDAVGEIFPLPSITVPKFPPVPKIPSVPSIPNLPKWPSIPKFTLPPTPAPFTPPPGTRVDGTIRFWNDDNLCLTPGWPMKVKECGPGSRPEFGFWYDEKDHTIRQASKPSSCINVNYNRDRDLKGQRGEVGTYACTPNLDREQWRVQDENAQFRQWKEQPGTQIKPWHRGLGGFNLVVGEIKVGGFLTIDNLDMRSIKSAFKKRKINSNNAIFNWYPYVSDMISYKLR